MSPSETLRVEVVELIWVATTIGAGMDDYGAMGKKEQEQLVNETAEAILEALLNKLPEKPADFDKFSPHYQQGWNAYEAEIRQILEGK